MRARMRCPPARLRTQTCASIAPHALTVCSTPKSRALQVVICAVVGALETPRYPLAQNLMLFCVVHFVFCGSFVLSVAAIRLTFVRVC